jgi:hypothetical protein
VSRLAVSLAALAALAACTSTVHPRAEPIAVAPGAPFPHTALGEVLAARVDAGGLVDYAGLAADRAGLDAYTATLAVVSPDSHPDRFADRDAALAYWINAYNALAITAVLDRPNLLSVNDDRYSVFLTTRYPVGGAPMSLYHLENGIIRKYYPDPRAHFALNCQSIGCPRLPREPFPEVGLDAALDAATAEFLADPRHVRVDGDTLMLSQIFQWYAKDFAAEGGPEGFVRARRPDLAPTARVAYLPYDWGLIAQPGRR